MRQFTQSDVDPTLLAEARIAVMGYGSQGRAQALNLRDSDHDVCIGLRSGSASATRAMADGFTVATPAAAAAGARFVVMLVPDMAQPAVFANLRSELKPGSTLVFAHGFSVHYQQIEPPPGVDVVLVAPKGPGELVRREYTAGRGVPCLAAVAQDCSGKALERALAYADAIGGTRSGVLETTFAEETETDLFGDQAVLCGGVTRLVCQGFETLVEAGYQPEVAYYECMHELKLIVDLLHEGGLTKMHEFISETAQYGDLSRGPRVVDAHTHNRMREILSEIQSGCFAREWIAENNAGRPNHERMLQAELAHPLEDVGKGLRERMAWQQPHESSQRVDSTLVPLVEEAS